MTNLRRFIEFAAGAGIGVLVGLIAGLSISPVTSTILGAVSTGLLILLGLKQPKGDEQADSHALRVLGFGLACSLALVAGIVLRTNSILSPSIQNQKQKLIDANVFTPTQVDQILLLTNFGLQPVTTPAPGDVGNSHAEQQPAAPSRQEQAAKPNKLAVTTPSQAGVISQTEPQIATAALGSAGFLRAGSASFCQTTRRQQFKDVHAYLDELRRIDPKLPAVIESVPESYRDQLSHSLSDYLCP